MLPMRTFKQLGTPYEQVTNGLEAVELVLRDLARFQLILLDNQVRARARRARGSRRARRMPRAARDNAATDVSEQTGCE